MKDFTKGSEWRQILTFALPMLFGNVFMQLYQFVDTAIVGKFIGKDALAAVGASTPVLFMTIALVIGIGIGASVVMSQYYGAKKFDKVQATLDTSMIFLLGAGIVVTFIGLFLSPFLLRLMRLPEELMPMATSYLSIYFVGMVPMFGYYAVASMLRGVGDSMTSLYFLIISTILNIVLDVLFIAGFGWGVSAAAWATVISQSVAFLLAVIYVNRKTMVIRFNIRNPRFDRQVFGECMRKGLPSGLQQTVVAVGMVALMGVVNGFGNDVIAAYSAVNRIDAFVSLPVMSFAAAITSFAGQNMGVGKFIRIKRGLKATLLMSTVTCVTLNLIMILFGRWILSVFTTDTAVIDIGYECMVVINSFYLLFNILFIINGMLRGAGATVYPMVNTILSLWLCRIPLAIFLSGIMGISGIWWSIPIAWGIGLIGSVIYYYSGRWKNKGVVRLAVNG